MFDAASALEWPIVPTKRASCSRKRQSTASENLCNEAETADTITLTFPNVAAALRFIDDELPPLTPHRAPKIHRPDYVLASTHDDVALWQLNPMAVGIGPKPVASVAWRCALGPYHAKRDIQRREEHVQLYQTNEAAVGRTERQRYDAVNDAISRKKNTKATTPGSATPSAVATSPMTTPTTTPLSSAAVTSSSSTGGKKRAADSSFSRDIVSSTTSQVAAASLTSASTESVSVDEVIAFSAAAAATSDASLPSVPSQTSTRFKRPKMIAGLAAPSSHNNLCRVTTIVLNLYCVPIAVSTAGESMFASVSQYGRHHRQCFDTTAGGATTDDAVAAWLRGGGQLGLTASDIVVLLDEVSRSVTDNSVVRGNSLRKEWLESMPNNMLLKLRAHGAEVRAWMANRTTVTSPEADRAFYPRKDTIRVLLSRQRASASFPGRLKQEMESLRVLVTRNAGALAESTMPSPGMSVFCLYLCVACFLLYLLIFACLTDCLSVCLPICLLFVNLYSFFSFIIIFIFILFLLFYYYYLFFFLFVYIIPFGGY